MTDDVISYLLAEVNASTLYWIQYLGQSHSRSQAEIYISFVDVRMYFLPIFHLIFISYHALIYRIDETGQN